MDVARLDYHLPKNLIADSPAKPRDHSCLLLIDRKTGKLSHHIFYEIADMLEPNDVLVLNKTKVFPARLHAKKITGGEVELLFIEETKPGIWTAMTHPGLKKGSQVIFKKHVFDVGGHEGMTAVIDTKMNKNAFLNLLSAFGKTPLPPYINSTDSEKNLRKEYQTVFAEKTGSVAAPTAGFHLTKELLNKLKKKGVQIEYVTLHVGLGTFAPVKTQKLEDHAMHFEYFELDKNTSKRLNLAKKSGKRIVSVGTTSTRVLESSVNSKGLLVPQKSETNLFIFPPYKFKFVDALVTNFHLPKSTLIALVSAFVSYPNTNEKFKDFDSSLMGMAYREAVKKKYRFYSFGDACLIS